MEKRKNSISLSLKTFERLAKLSEPAIIFIIEYSDQDQVEAVYYIHILGDPLATLLKRLTKISTKGNQISSNEKISYAKKKNWKKIEHSSSGLKHALENEIVKSHTPESYAEVKNEQLKRLGYDENYLTGEFTITGKTLDELDDALLGLRDGNLVNHVLEEERFSIKRELFRFKADKTSVLKIKPNGRPAIAHFFTENDSNPLVFEGEIIVSPLQNATVESWRFLFKCPPLQLDIKSTGSMKFKFPEIFEIECTAKKWQKTFKFLNAIVHTKSDFKFFDENHKPFLGGAFDNNFMISDKAKSINKYILEISNNLIKILERCGGDNLKFSLENLHSSAEEVKDCFNMIFISNTELTAKLDFLNRKTNLGLEKGKFISLIKNFQIGKYTFAYKSKMQIESIEGGNQPKLICKTLSSGVVSIITEGGVEDFKKINFEPNEIVIDWTIK